jgi:hypothetical protein
MVMFSLKLYAWLNYQVSKANFNLSSLQNNILTNIYIAYLKASTTTTTMSWSSTLSEQALFNKIFPIISILISKSADFKISENFCYRPVTV